ncbi:hypothetical protein B0H67DRAFT_642774 [Lasiosphaeris hirsuta]|uniref:Uncharacterized protein n=1 Tax=Lasiosphaeris hirsuta TaxID=260670 RepID=A0AA40E1P8_9PEZI|nr:hypothetical protein B0H67DRAFT_642774 [Lasiosphaeris hirsuta]
MNQLAAPWSLALCQRDDAVPCSQKSPVDADIAGIGVVLSFLISTLITLVAIIVGYFGGFLRPERYRPADREFILTFRRLFRLDADSDIKALGGRSLAHIEAFEGFMLSFSDQQLVVGLAILIAVYAKSCNLSVFSFELAVALAFFSLMIHLFTLSVLRTYLHDHPRVLWVRLIAVVLYAILMLISLVLSRSASFRAQSDKQVRCALSDFSFKSPQERSLVQFGNTALILWFVVSSYGTAITELFGSSSEQCFGSWYFWLIFRLRNDAFNESRQARLKGRRKGWNSGKPMPAFIFAVQEVARSFLWKMLWMLFYFTFALTNFLLLFWPQNTTGRA